MRNNVLIFFLLLILNIKCYSSDKFDINNIDFFGIKLKYNQDEIIKVLKNQKKDYIVKEDQYFPGLISIVPKNQNIEEGLNLDFEINIYKEEKLSFKKYNIEDGYLKYLNNKLGKEKSVKKTDNKIIYFWSFGLTNIEFEILKKYKNESIFVIFNKNVQEKLQKFRESKYVNISYEVNTDNLRFRESPTIDGKLIRMLKKGEMLEFIESGKEDTINGIKGTWIKVKTEQGEVGWCFDAYLTKFEFE